MARMRGQVFQPTGRTGDGRPWYVRYVDSITGKRVSTRATLPPLVEGGPVRFAGTEEEATASLAIAISTSTRQAANGVRDVTFDEFRATYTPGGSSERHKRIVAAQLKTAADPPSKNGGGLGPVLMHRIGRAEAQRYADALKAGGAGGATVRRHLAALSGCWKAAIEASAATVNPWHVGGLRLDEVTAPTIRFRSEAEVRQMIARCPKRIRPLLRFIAATGCRYSEAAGMKWSEVSDDLERITIPADRTKTRKVRNIRVENDARAVLEQCRKARIAPMDASADYVFALRPATKKKPARVYSHGYVFKLLQTALDKAKIPSERPFHTLRNSVASRMVLSGVPLSVVAEAIGDSLATTSKHYAHLIPDDAVARAYQSLARRPGSAQSKSQEHASRQKPETRQATTRSA